MTESVDNHTEKQDYFSKITAWMTVRRNVFGEYLISTRVIGEAMGLTIYQARSYLQALYDEGIVDRNHCGRGSPVLWYLT